MRKQKTHSDYIIEFHGKNAKLGTNTILCAVCKSDKNFEFITITDCNLCGKCKDELAEGFEQAMTMDRDDYPEL